MKALKKLSCVLLAVLLIMSLSTTAFAASGAPTPVTPADEVAFHLSISKNDDATHAYKAYQIFVGDLAKDAEGKEILSNVEWGNGLDAEGKAALAEAAGVKGETDAAKVAEAIATNKISADALATAIAAHVVPGSAIALTDAGTVYTSAALDAGYYLVLDELVEDAEGSAMSDYIVQLLGDTTMEPKASAPSVEKKVKDKNDSTGETSGWQDSADYDIGDPIPFQLTATLPTRYADYDSYKLVFHDTSEHLSIPAEVTVRFGESTQTVPTTIPGSDGCSFEVVIENVRKMFPDAGAGDQIVVTYEATLQEGAALGVAGNPNKVVLEYSNNPNGEGTGRTPEDKVTVFTFEFDVNKVQPDGVDAEGKPTYKALEGAGFTLSKWNGTAWETVGGEQTGVTEFKFVGLDDGRYKIEETTTPAGFNTIDPIYFEVTAVHDGDSANPKLTGLTVTQVKEDGSAVEEGDVTFKPSINMEGGVFTAQIVNQSGLELPETGGIGTTIFYTVGGILVVVALVLLVTKKRMTKEG